MGNGNMVGMRVGLAVGTGTQALGALTDAMKETRMGEVTAELKGWTRAARWELL